METWANPIIQQYINVSDQHTVHLTYTKVYVNYSSINLGGAGEEKNV